MKTSSPKLFIEINNSEYIFCVGHEDEQSEIQFIYKIIIPIKGIKNYRIVDFNLVFNSIKENIYLIERKFNYIFKDVVIVLNNFNISVVNLSGFKKLNGSQVLKDDITYILNSLKSNVDETEKNKTIIHIFNSKYNLDKKDIKNLPIGLFGDFYFHELSFFLINNNDYKNLSNIFSACNLKIKKILLKNFVCGTLISKKNENLNNFYKITINENNSEVFYFENDSLKFEQKFNFGYDLILKDISKITSLNQETVNKIINNMKLNRNIPCNDLIEAEIFENHNYVKIKKKLILEIAEARIHELFEIFITKNINLQSYVKKNKAVFFKIENKSYLDCFEETFRIFFSSNNMEFKLEDDISTEDLLINANQIVQFGWKKEAIPVINTKKTLIAKFFDTLFG
jgi:cell division protein FtsA